MPRLALAAILPALSIGALLGSLVSAMFLPRIALARFVKAEDLPAVSELERARIDVDKMGRSHVTIDRVIRVVNDEGRERESLQSIDFNDRTSKMTILLAETVNGTNHVPVAKKNIEVKPVGDFSRYFDTMKRAKINFPQVKSGSRIHLRYRIDVHEVPNEGFWSFMADFNWWYMEKYDAVITSELPLYHWKNDSEGVFEIKTSEVHGKHVITVKSTRPIIRLTTQEENPFIRSERSLAFGVTSLNDWHKFAGLTIQRQEKLLDQRLPPSMERIREAALKEKTTVDKLNRVAALISHDYRYFGDWRHRNGGYLPRPMPEIHATRYGDCKDLSLVAVAIYRSMGLEADLAWTIRGEPHVRPNPDAYKMPIDWFNHAITRVKADGRIFWIDPTNPVAHASFLPTDIAGKPAFVLNANDPHLEYTPELQASESSRHWEFVYDYQPNHTFKVTGKLKLSGRAAVYQATNLVYKPLEAVKYDLLRSLSFGRKISDSWLGDLPGATRIVSDIDVPFRFTLNEGGVRTSAGYGFLLTRESPVDRLLEDVHGRVSDFYLDSPVVWTSREELVGVTRVGRMNMNCDLKTKWIAFNRQVSDTINGVLVLDRVEILKNIIPNEELITPAFEKFQNELRECFYRAAIVFKPARGD